LTELPKSLEKLANLRELHLNENELTKKSFGDIALENTKLVSLSVASNQLLSFPFGFTQCLTLEKLNLQENQIMEISTAIGSLKNLQFLNMNQNRLKALCPALLEIPSLKALSIANNEIESEPSEMSSLRSRLLLLRTTPMFFQPKLFSLPILSPTSNNGRGGRKSLFDKAKGRADLPVAANQPDVCGVCSLFPVPFSSQPFLTLHLWLL